MKSLAERRAAANVRTSWNSKSDPADEARIAALLVRIRTLDKWRSVMIDCKLGTASEERIEMCVQEMSARLALLRRELET